MESWGKRWNIKNSEFWNRLNGANNFCRKDFSPEAQARSTYKYADVRYRHWNFCYMIHKTLECRMLPVFKEVRIAKAAATEVYDIVESWLEKSPEEFSVGGKEYVTE